jgi:hypothetical protein
MNATATLERCESRLLRIPGVTSVGLTEQDGKEVIVVFVTKDDPRGIPGGSAAIPAEIEGVATIVRPAIRVGPV